MDIAVIIPLYNGARFIEKTLISVFSQSKCPAEVVIVDDGSEDESLEIIKDFSHIKILKNSTKGAAAARNYGLNHTTSPLVAFLDQDDIWHPDHLKILSNLLEKYPESPAAISGITNFYYEKELIFTSWIHQEIFVNPWDIFPCDSLSGPSSVLIRRNALNSIGGWPNHLVITDAYTWFRISLLNPLIKNRGSTVGRRRYNNSIGYILREQNRFIDNYMEAVKDVLNYRVAIYPSDADFLIKRVETFSCISSIIDAVVNLNSELFLQSTLTFENYLKFESPQFIKSTIHGLFWYLDPFIINNENTKSFIIKNCKNTSSNHFIKKMIALNKISLKDIFIHKLNYEMIYIFVYFNLKKATLGYLKRILKSVIQYLIDLGVNEQSNRNLRKG